MKNIILLLSSQYLMMVITHNSYFSNNANHATYKDADDWGWFIIVNYFMMVITHNSFSILQYLVVGLDHFLFFPYIYIYILELSSQLTFIFFRGVGIPPTSNG